MGRFTYVDENGVVRFNIGNYEVSIEWLAKNKCYPGLKQIAEKLAQYEDLEEQGKLIKLPCKVGDTVYVKVQSGEYAEAEVRDFTYFLTCGFCIVVTSEKFDKQNIPFTDFGKTVFLTHEEAEAALKKMEVECMLKIGDKVVKNNKYYVPSVHRKVVFKVASEPRMLCGTEVVNIVALDGNIRIHACATDGLDKISD